MRLYLAHGKEGNPWGAKMIALADVAKLKGFQVEIPDYSDLTDPDARVQRLIDLCGNSDETTVLVGSSMGGYVSTVASPVIKPDGLFLLAPAFYLPNYQVHEPGPCCWKTFIIHGWNDEVVPVDNSIRFARDHKSELHLVDGDHRLMDQLSLIERLFALFLDGIIGHKSSPPTLGSQRLGWGAVAEAVDRALRDLPQEGNECMDWFQRIWARIEAQGDVDYTSEDQLQQVVIRLMALIDFYRAFVLLATEEFDGDCDIESDCDGNCPCEKYERKRAGGDKSGDLDVRVKNLLSQLTGRNEMPQDYERKKTEVPTPMALDRALDRAINDVVYPAIRNEYPMATWLATTLCSTVSSCWWATNPMDFLTDPEEPASLPCHIEDYKGYQFVLSWIESKFCYAKTDAKQLPAFSFHTRR